MVPYVSIIIPTLNEENNLPRLFTSLEKLDYPKTRIEVLIIDGGSTDKTITIAKQFGARIYNNPKHLRGAGCQIGVDHTRGSIIAFTDADCSVPRHWLGGLIKHLQGEKIASVGGPNKTPESDSLFAQAVGDTLALLTKPGSRYGFTAGYVTPIFHNPGCNVVYKKDAIINSGGFNSALITCEDEELDWRILNAGYMILFTPDVTVDHYRRFSYRSIFIQAYRYAMGRAQAIRLHPPMARWFHFGPTAVLVFPIILVLLLLIQLQLLLLTGGYLVLGILAMCICSIVLSIKNKHAPWWTYTRITALWFWGWSIGFGLGLLGIIKDIR